MLELIKIQKDNNLLIFEGYSFSTYRKNIWRCTEYKSKNCLTRCYTTTDDLSGFLIYKCIINYYRTRISHILTRLDLRRGRQRGHVSKTNIVIEPPDKT